MVNSPETSPSWYDYLWQCIDDFTTELITDKPSVPKLMYLLKEIKMMVSEEKYNELLDLLKRYGANTS